MMRPLCRTADTARDPEGCMWYTIFHVLLGSSFIAAALGLWADALVRDSHARTAELKNIIRDDHLKVSKEASALGKRKYVE
jgi:hypothetical protein